MELTKQDYIAILCKTVSIKSTCPRAAVGAVFVNDDFNILATGYNGAPCGQPHCSDIGCDVDAANHCTRAVHAEVNAIVQAAKEGIDLKGSTLWLTMTPCKRCAALLANLRLKGVVYIGEIYRETEALKILEDAGIRHEKYQSPLYTQWSFIIENFINSNTKHMYTDPKSDNR